MRAGMKSDGLQVAQSASVEHPFKGAWELPVPRPDISAYQWNKFMAFATSPRRLVNYICYLSAKRGAKVPYLPIKLDAENVSRCNFHCTMCEVSDWPSYQRAADMSLEDFKRLIDSQYGLIELKLQGLGEPLLGRDGFFEMIQYARSKHIWVRTTTNASLLHFRDNYKKLIDSGINEVQISIDGASKATFEKIRRGSKFELVVENCKLINDYCDKLGVLRTRMWTLLQNQNIHEFSDFVDFAAEMGFRRMTYSVDLHGWGVEKWIAANREVSRTDGITPEMARGAVEEGKKRHVEVTFWNVSAKYSTKTPQSLCPWPFERAYVSSDLRIVPCCMVANPNVADLGDARDFTAHWKGDVYAEFRQAHLDGRIPRICQGCYQSPSDSQKPCSSDTHA